MKRAYFLLFILLFGMLLLPACAASKSKKCDCPKFGMQDKPERISPVKKGKDS